MHQLEETLRAARSFATDIIFDYPNSIVYHNIKFAERYVGFMDKVGSHAKLKEETIALGRIGAWLVAASYRNSKPRINKKGLPESNLEENIIETANNFFLKNPFDEKNKEALYAAFREMVYPKVPQTLLGKLLKDGLTADLVIGKSNKRLKALHKELILQDIGISRKKWYDLAIGITSNLAFELPYCREEFQPKIDKLTLDLTKEKKNLEKSNDLALKKELDISDQELKDLKKNLKSIKGRDARGIQTAFRTTSKNHYTLNEMVDKKANIMITVNSIILSLVLGGVIGTKIGDATFQESLDFIPVFILTLTAMGSIIFAILSIRPGITHGQFTEKDIRNKGGNLLFYGNFHGMGERDYEWAFLQMINDQDHLYSTMIKDIYYLGKILERKYKHIRISLTIFLIGLSLSVLSYIIVTSLCLI